MTSVPPKFNVVLYQPEIPQNTGNIGRTCVAVGAKLWIVRPTGFRLDDHHVRRSGLDYWQHLDWESVDQFENWRSTLPSQRTFFVTKFARREYTSVAYERGDFFVFGCESTGLPPTLRDAYPDQCIQLPMDPAARSLNLANAVAIVLYEAWRQVRCIATDVG